MNFLFIKNPTSATVEYDVPDTGIVLWYGTSSTMPSGWEIYTTASGVFMMGAGSGNMSTTSAGSETHTHAMPSTSTRSAHTHTGNTTIGSSNSDDEGYGSTTYSASTQNHTHPNESNSFSEAGEHYHTIDDTGSATNLRMYHRLYWIRRVVA